MDSIDARHERFTMVDDCGNEQSNAYSRCVLLKPVAAQSAPAAARRQTRSAYDIGSRITCIDRQIIRRYFARAAKSVERRLPHTSSGRGMFESWPQAVGRQLPADLERTLSALNADLTRILDGSDVLLVERATRRVVDKMKNAAACRCGVI